MVLADLISESGRDILIALALIVITATLLLRVYRRLGPRSRATPAVIKSPRSAEVPISTGGAQERRIETPADVNRWKVEMYELARDLSGRLDSKMGALEQLILMADDRIARLEALLERADEATTHASDSDPPGVL